MSQVQSEVRPNVTRMPMSGFLLQTGGSARRRIIKPLNKQAGTDSFPIQNEFHVSGVPGHTHNSSAVASVMVDMIRPRGFGLDFEGWSEEKIEMKADDPGDSEQVADEDVRFDRALERGIGEIALRPENCHHEIREPMRSIAEIRTLVAPDDRLQTLTYVEEVGGFINKDKTSYISEFPDIYIDLLGYRDMNLAERDGGGYLTNEASATPIRISVDGVRDAQVEATEMVVLRPAQNAQHEHVKSIGYFDDGTAGAADDDAKNWYGIVRFRWQPLEKLYRSDAFDVTFRRVVEVRNDRNAGDADLAAKTLHVRFPMIETTRAENGYCFLMNSRINSTQAIRNTSASKGDQFRAKIPIVVFTETITVNGTFHFETDCAYRIKVGGNYTFPGFLSSNDATKPSYFQQIANMRPKALAARYEAVFAQQLADGDVGFAANGTLFDNQGDMFGGSFGMFKTNRELRFPQVFPRNSQRGASFEGLLQPVFIPSRIMKNPPATFLLTAFDQPAHVTDNRCLISQALATLDDAAPDGQWNGTLAAGPNQIILEEDDVRSIYDENLVRPPLHATADAADQDDPTDVGTYWHWKANIAPTITSIAINDAQAVNLRIPDARTWYTRRVDLRKKMFISGGGLDNVNIAAIVSPANTHVVFNTGKLQTEMITIPAVVDFYYNREDFGFDYNQVNDAGGQPDFYQSTLTPVAPRTTKRFYILGDIEADLDAHRYGLTLDTTPLFDLVQISNHDPVKPISVIDVRFPADGRAGGGADPNIELFTKGFGIGHIMDLGQHCVRAYNHPQFDDCRYAGNRLPVIFSARASLKYTNTIELWVQNLHFSFDGNRTFFLGTNFMGTQAANGDGAHNGFYFHTKDCRLQMCTAAGSTATVPGDTCVTTVIERLYRSDGGVCQHIDTPFGNFGAGQVNLFGGVAGHQDFVGLCYLGRKAQETWFGDPDDTHVTRQVAPGQARQFLKTEVVTIFDSLLKESNELGPVFQSKKRISQHLCAPIVNPNMRIGCTAPLNFETGHLPPELRDFRLELRDVDFSFLPGKVNIEPLVLYEFNGGNQTPAAHDNLLHLPQFREGKTYVDTSGNFSLEMFSPYGMPSYIAVFCRDVDRSRDYMTQPIIKQLTIMCTTTQKKSNTILEANVHQLYHITQRNVNQRSRYNRQTFNKRQVILISAEDVGMMGLESYQMEKRAKLQFSGTSDQLGQVNVLLIFNNRGLYIQGKHMSIVRLRE